MTPSPQAAGASSAPLPPLPDLSGNGGGAAQAGPGGGFMAALMAAVTPVKSAVDMINAACQKIVQSGSVPGSEQICGQIVGLANQLTVMAMQQASQGQGAGGQQGMGAPPSMGPPPPGAPPMQMGQGQ